MWKYNYTDELYHSGRKGMKWGQHIFTKARDLKNRVMYRNKDGTLKPRGQKKAAKLEIKYKRVTGTSLDNPNKFTDLLKEQRKIKTDEKTRKAAAKESKKIIRRNKGKDFILRAYKTSIEPAIFDAGKDVLKNTLIRVGNEYLNPKKVSEYDRLKRQSELLKYQYETANYRDKLNELNKKNNKNK